MIFRKADRKILLVAADIGGTNSRFALFKTQLPDDIEEMRGVSPLDHPPFEMVFSKNFLNESFSMFQDVMNEFFRDAEQHSTFDKESQTVSACCLAVAGPVENGRVNFTNSRWLIDKNSIKESFGISEVTVVNDFVASGYGVLTLTENELTVIQEGRHSVRAPIAVLGAGTGLGECFMTPGELNGSPFYDVFPTEGGHVEFAPKTPIQFRCLQFLQEKFSGRVSVERIVSGKGLLNVYEFFKHENPDDVKEQYDQEIVNAVQAGGKIASLAYDYELCARTMEFVFEVYGTEAGSVALKYLPYGGLYIAGSLAPRNIERLAGPETVFLKSAMDMGRVSPVLRSIPIKVVMCEDLGMRGSQLLAYKLCLEAEAGILAPDLPSRDVPSVRRTTSMFDTATQPSVLAPMLYTKQRKSVDMTFVTEMALASSIAASVALMFGFGARELARISNQ